MTPSQKISYYVTLGDSLMQRYQKITGNIFFIEHPEVEQSFWKRADTGDVKKLMFSVNQIASLTDSASESE